MSGRWRMAVLLAVALGAAASAPGEGPPDPPAPAAPARDPLALLGIPVTGGAASGYVADSVCATCHADLARSFAEVGMGKSFYRFTPERSIEDFAAARFAHAPSREQYEMTRREDGGLLFRRHQLDADGRAVNPFEVEVDWVLGSGHHARTYLYRTANGELYQLPLAWYAQSGKWAMAPGYDRADHDGVTRRVRRECMFCHNGYPDVPAGSDAHHEPPVYPAELPEGVGCQRCHGPGAEHARRAMGGHAAAGEVRAAIVNPGRLDPARRDEICFGCHLQPTVVQPGVRRLGRGDYSFRPGEPLAEYLVQVDMREPGRDPAARFEINHHPYRLLQSRCFRASAGRLSCLTCHDPHRKVPVAQRPAHYRAACRQCHAPEACPETGHTEANGAAAADGAAMAAAADCVSCHMPERRTQDVVEVTMTDHLIQRRPAPAEERLRPLPETDPILGEVVLFDRPGAPRTEPRARVDPAELSELYIALAVVRAHGAAAPGAADRLQEELAARNTKEVEPYLDLASAQLLERRFAAAEATLRGVLARAPAHTLAREWLALARASQGHRDEAITILRQVRELAPDRAETRYNLGRLLLAAGGPQGAEEAAAEFERAVALRANFTAAWFRLGDAEVLRERPAAAETAYRRALAIDPRHGDAYAALGRLLRRQGDSAEAARVLRHGAQVARHPERVRAALAEED